MTDTARGSGSSAAPIPGETEAAGGGRVLSSVEAKAVLEDMMADICAHADDVFDGTAARFALVVWPDGFHGDQDAIAVFAQPEAQPFAVEALQSAAKALATGAPPMSASETWGSIAAWCEATFGPVTLERAAARANEEMQELLADPSNVIEAADVCIVLSRYPGLAEAIDRKMAINRARQWNLRGDGTGYHIKEQSQ